MKKQLLFTAAATLAVPALLSCTGQERVPPRVATANFGDGMGMAIAHADSSDDIFGIGARKTQMQLAGLQRRDAPPASRGGPRGGQPAQGARPLHSVPLVYPYDLAIKGTEGSALLSYDVDDRGSPHNIKVVSASAPPFGIFAAAALAGARFDRPMPGQRYRVSFTRDMIDSEAVSVLKDSPSDIVPPSEIDNGLELVGLADAPIFPEAELKAGVVQGDADIEFLVDPDGETTMPRVLFTTRDDFGATAATAVLSRQYEPPRKNGVPVYVRVRQSFTFSPKDVSASDPLK